MSKGHGVSGKTHTKQQLNDYANQNNPNNKAYQARKANERQYAKKKKAYSMDTVADLECRQFFSTCLLSFFIKLFTWKPTHLHH